MLRFRSERISIGLCHDSIGGIRQKNEVSENLPVIRYDQAVVGTHSTASADALEKWLDAQELKGQHASVVLSNHFVRYALIPWSDTLLSVQEEDILFRTKFEELYGDMDDWQVLANAPEYGKARIVCAVHQVLIHRINEIWKTKGIKGGSIVPYFVACWNRWQRSFHQRGGMIAVAEMQSVVIGCFGKNGWSSLRSISVSPTSTNLSDIVFREGLLQRHSSPIPVWIHTLAPLPSGENPFIAGEKLLKLDLPNEDPCLTMARVGSL